MEAASVAANTRSSSRSVARARGRDKPGLFTACGECALPAIPCSQSVSIKMRELAEDREPLLDLFAGEMLQALGAEALHGEGAHHAAVEHGSLEDLRRQFGLRGNVAKEASGE